MQRAPAKKAAAKKKQEHHEPPQVCATLRSADVFRYKVSAAVSGTSITWRCLQRILFVNYGANTGRTCFQSFKIKKLEIWSPPLYGTSYNLATPIEVRTQTGDGALATEKLYSDVSTNAKGAHLKVKFDEHTTDIGKWHDGAYAYSADSVAFKLTLPVGTILDLHFAYQLAVTVGSSIALTTSSSAAGAICTNYLDSVSTGGSAGAASIAPVNYLTTLAEAF